MIYSLGHKRKSRKVVRRERRRARWQKIGQFFNKYMSQCIVTFAILTVLVFSVLNIVFAALGLEMSSTFIEYFFKFFGFEMLALSGIKISKHIGSAFGKAEEAVDGVYVEDDENEEPIEEDNQDEFSS